MLFRFARSPGFSALIACSGAVIFLGCGTEARPREDLGTSHSALTAANGAAVPTASASTIPWGGSSLGFRATLPDALAQGPAALAMTDDGRLLVADGQNGRIAELIGFDGTQPLGIRTFASAARDIRDLAVAPDGAVAYARQLSADVTVLEPEGQPSGTLSMRDLPHTDGLAFGPSRRVIAETSFQESFTLGSAHAPMARESTLLGKKEGIGQLSQGRRASVIKDASGRITLRIHKGDALVSFPLVQASAARVVGARGDVACVRIEHANDSSGTMKVTREVQCVNATSGDVILRRDLGEPGEYVPYKELSLGKGRLAFMKPTDKGLVVSTFVVEGAR
jgi:hypothetical protein